MAVAASQEHAGLVQAYEESGYAIARQVIDGELLAEARAHVAWLLRAHPGFRPENLRDDLIGSDPFWVRLVSDARLLDVAERFIGPDIALFAAHYIAKPPYEGLPVLWHQDGSYWPLEPMSVVSLWLALDDSDAQNGCMRVIPATHRDRLQRMQPRTDVENLFGSGMLSDQVDESRAVDVVLRAGDVSVHHPHIVHGSGANRSGRWRRGLTIRYIPTSTRITRQPWPCAFLLRGEARPGINSYRPHPRWIVGRHPRFRGCDAWAEAGAGGAS